MSNPLLQDGNVPVDYPSITVESMQDAFDQVLEQYAQGIERVINSQPSMPTWDDLVLAMDDLDAQVYAVLYGVMPFLGKGQTWSDPILAFHIAASAALDSRFSNEQLQSLYEQLAHSDIGVNLDDRQRATLRWHLERFRVSGASLPTSDKARLLDLQRRITELEEQYLINLDQPDMIVDDVTQLRGLSQRSLDELSERARQRGSNGWSIPCESWAAERVLEEAELGALREQVYQAFHGRGVNTDLSQDNGQVLQQLALLRHERATLLAFSDHMTLSLARKSAGSPDQVRALLQSLAAGMKPVVLQWRSDFERDAQALGLEDMQPWDLRFAQKQLRDAAKIVPKDALREFFPMAAVIDALVQLAKRLFDLELRPTPAPVWAPSVLVFEAFQDDARIGLLYLDAVQHAGKQAEAVFTTYVRNRRIDAEGIFQQAVVIVFSDVPEGSAGAQPLLDHLALRKLYHEFGHALHHLLVRTDNQIQSGVVELGTDGTELFGKLFERWVWNAAYLVSISSHYSDGRQIDRAQVEQCVERYRREAIGEAALELSKALFDVDLHTNPADGKTLRQRFTRSREQCGYWPLNALEHPAHAFDHLVTGYDAGYYAYLWADVCAVDIFTRFEQTGLLDRALGQALFESLIAPGASRPLREGVMQFLGRETNLHPYLQWLQAVG
ncbi:peptidase M3 [Pseudomonas fulva]|uniref:M3 family metallopeptidase n=1 Tax=Pseudomonas fulva TaxID=47880 RepID=UPI000CE95002|nr:M3 family metallopeptidase [Pseudomonas fulva]AVF57668.1 peptidase M3 [Pseudomonas fulva]